MSWINIMALSGRIFFWLLLCASFLPGNADDISNIRGVPGKDYPNYSSIPQTSFRCSEQPHIPGLYADLETRCQVFHYCYEHRQESFLCPLGTVFNQAILACDYWYSADCSAASLYHGGGDNDDSPHQAIIYDREPGIVPIKTSSGSLFDKMASLYEVNDGSSLSDSRNEADYLEGNHYFSDIDRSLIVQSKPTIKNRNFVETADHYDRHDIVSDELPKDYEYIQNSDDLEENFQNFEDTFVGSGEFLGESKELEEEVLSQGSNLWPSNEKGDFDDEQFTIMQEEHDEGKTKPHKGGPMDHLTDFSHILHSSPKVSSELGEKLVKRYSENNVNPYSRKSTRRRPIFIIDESSAEITSTELSKGKMTTNSFDSDDQSTTSAPTEPMPASNFPNILATSYKAKRKRKPIMIDLEDSLQYNIDSTQYPDGGASVNYKVNPQSVMPGYSISAQEISVKLIPSEAKLKPVDGYLFNHYNRENKEKTESSTASYITSPESNIRYEATTFPTFKEFEIKDVAVSFDRINPIRKKEEIRIIDSDNNLIGIDHNEQDTTPLQALQFEDETVTQPVEVEFETIEDNFPDISKETKERSEQVLMPEVSLKEDEVATHPSYFIPEHDTVILNNIVPDSDDILQVTQDDPDTSFQTYDSLDQSYISDINHESSLETEKFVDDSDLEDKTDYIILKSLPEFDFTTYDEMQDEKYFTTESISHITTSVPLEIENTKDSESNFYLIPQADFESEYDHSGISKNVWRPAPVTLDGKNVNGQLESGSFDLHPSYHMFREDSIRDETTELMNSEDFELQNIINDNDTEIEHIPNTELIDHKKRTSASSMSKDNANYNYTSSEEMPTASDKLLDADHKDHLFHSNANLNITTKLDHNLTESMQTEDPALKNSTAKQSSEIQRYIVDGSVDFDAMKNHDGDQDQIASLRLNSPQPENTKHKDNSDSKYIQGVIDLSNNIFETTNRFDSVPSFTSNSILETSEHPLFWENFNNLQKGGFNSNQKLSKNLGTKPDISQVIDSNQLKITEKPTISKAHSVLFPTNKGNTENVKTRPLRSAKALASPYQMNFNMQALGSQYLAGLPSTMLKLKPSNIKKLLPYSGPDFDDGIFYARTGGLLESPKIAKLISIGKNLLRAKRAKYRILSRYVNSFNSNK